MPTKTNNKESWEDRFDKQFGTARADICDGSDGRRAGCDDCSANIEIRNEHKEFVRTILHQRESEIVEICNNYIEKVGGCDDVKNIINLIKQTK